ncbi:WD40-repeat-containing domain protein [Baffinella frigidus]|nr:WD40-repeat-containing domain protein [Cryptophyta sp. CCMP2293]
MNPVLEALGAQASRKGVPGGLAVSGSADETVKIWRLGQSEDGPPLECIDTLSGHKGPISCLAVCQDAVLSGSLDKTIVVWERSTRPSLPQGSFAKTQVLREAKGVVASIAVFAAPASPGRMWVAAATGMGEIVVWEAGTWTVLHRFTGAHRKVIKMVCAPSPLDATLISADEKRVKDIHVHEDDDQDQGPKDSICSLYIAPDKAVILAGNMFGTVAVCHTIE